MRIVVKLFALMRDKVGTDTVVLEVPEGASVAQALAILGQLHPVLAGYLNNARPALHLDFVGAEQGLAEGDELSLIPPVSGGEA